MKEKNRINWLLLFLLPLACNEKKAFLKIKIEKILITSAVSSGSGLASLNDSIFVVGDDAEYIGKISLTDTEYRRIPFYPNAPANRIDRAIKHDLESGALGNIGNDKYLFAFGSGTISPYRDTLFVLNVYDEGKRSKYSLSTFYDAIRLKTGLKENELNIEGVAIINDKLLLFNRGKNFLVLVPWAKFTQYILRQDLSDSLPFAILNISLPMVNNFPVGFSGACALNESDLLFTASLEETKDFTKDGVIKGSYIGILELVNDTTVNLVSMTTLKNEDGNIVLDKLESIEVIKTKANNIRSIAVADNDDGTSKVFYLNIERN